MSAKQILQRYSLAVVMKPCWLTDICIYKFSRPLSIFNWYVCQYTETCAQTHKKQARDALYPGSAWYPNTPKCGGFFRKSVSAQSSLLTSGICGANPVSVMSLSVDSSCLTPRVLQAFAHVSSKNHTKSVFVKVTLHSKHPHTISLSQD